MSVPRFSFYHWPEWKKSFCEILNNKNNLAWNLPLCFCYGEVNGSHSCVRVLEFLWHESNDGNYESYKAFKKDTNNDIFALLSKALIIAPVTYWNSKKYLQLIYSEAFFCSLFSEKIFKLYSCSHNFQGQDNKMYTPTGNLLLVIKDPVIKRILN